MSIHVALLRACFAEGRSIAGPAVPAGIAREAGLDVERAQAILATDEFAREVRAAGAFYLRNGINRVRAVSLERKHLISGGRPVEVFEQALRQVAALRR